MDNNDSTKPQQQTGGLKLMTVFIAVLALHVLVIGGFTVYHLMSSGSDADLALDKTHKLKADGTVATDTSATDTATQDKTADATAPAPPTTGAAANPASSTTASTTAATPAPDATATASSPAESTAPAETPPATPAPVASAASAPANTGATTPLVLTSEDIQNSPANSAAASAAPAIAPGLLPPPDQTAAPSGPAAAPAPATMASAPATTPAPAMTPAIAPHMAMTPAPVAPSAPEPAPAAPTASGPIMPSGEVASGPVHMPANPPVPSASSQAPGESHVAAMTHEMKKEMYTVKITDSFKKIAHAHHISVAQLKEANHIKGDTLHAGEKLVIPMEKTSVAKSEKSHEDATAVLAASPAPSAMEHRHIYTVSKGDTLAYIAKKFDVSVPALKEANDVASSKQLKPGEKLRIPWKESRSAVVSAPAPAPAPVRATPSQVVTQPAPIAQPAPISPPQQTEPVTAPEPTQPPTGNPALANLTF